MLAPIRRKQEFDLLSRHGRRGRSRPVWVLRTVSSDDAKPTLLAFALPRSVGTAVVRNRIRRRLREIMRTLDQQGDLPPGLYLVGASSDAADLDFRTLRQRLETAIEAAS